MIFMLEREIFGTDVYHILSAFVIYSVLGWLVESIYMSFCNKKITNRGFGKGPFCPIYGVGAIAGYMILSPLENNYIGLYLAGAVLATTFEYIVGRLMIRFLGGLWWDYNEKPFNYKGIICLESTVAWGFYAIIIVNFLNSAVYRLIGRIEREIGVYILMGVFITVFIDYSIQLMKVFNVDIKEKYKRVGERIGIFK